MTILLHASVVDMLRKSCSAMNLRIIDALTPSGEIVDADDDDTDADTDADFDDGVEYVGRTVDDAGRLETA